MKITKLLPVTLALLLGMSGAYAAQATDRADYKLELPTYFNITATAPAAAATVTYSGDYDTINVANISGSYHVTSNIDKKDLYFYATCQTGETETAALYGTASAPKLVFTNTQIGTANNIALTSSDVAAIRAGANDPTKSPNAIVLPLTITSQIVEGSAPSGKTVSAPELSGTNNVKYSIPNCKVDFTCSVGGGAADNSFSTLDTDGLYRATLYLSDTAQTL